MRPISIRMAAFGSFAGEVQISFDNLTEALFLISGDTGAGKTTIFDAITFALYGKASGGVRSGRMMRSHYAEDKQETFVEFAFLHKEGVYTVYRTPSYERNYVQKNGRERLRSYTETASLKKPDGTEVSGRIKDVNAQIESLIGLDFQQFSQLVMIAQGDFMKLLRARSEEKKKIFSKLFHTEFCRRMIESMQQQRGQLEKKKDENLALCRRELESFTGYEPEFLIGEHLTTVSQENAVNLHAAQLMEALSDRCGTNRAALDRMQEESAALTARCETLKNRLQDAAQTAQALQQERRSAAENTKRQTQVRQLYAESGQQLKRVEELYDAKAPGIMEEAAVLRGKLPEYEKRDAIVREKSRLEELFGEQKKQLAACEQALADNQEALRCIRQELMQMQSVDSEAASAAEQEKALRRQTDELAALKESAQALPDSRSEWESRRALTQQAIGAYEQAREKYNELYSLFLRGQAGILSQRLEQGQPCPVCGSKEHPHPAACDGGMPTQESVEAAQKLAQQANKAADEAVQQSRDADLTYRHAFQSAKENVGRILKGWHAQDTSGGCVTEFHEEQPAALQEFVSKLYAESREAETLCRQRLDKLRTQKREQEDKQAQLQRLEQAMEKGRAQQAQNREMLAQTEKNLAAMQAALDNLTDALTFRTQEEARQRLSLIDKELCKLKEEKQEAQEKAKQLEQQTVILEEKLREGKRREESLAEKWELIAAELRSTYQTEDMDTLSGLLDEYRRGEQETRQALGRQQALTDREEEAFLRLKNLLREREKIWGSLRPVEALLATAAGRVSGGAKLDFETYLQREYLKRILQQANHRLLEMSRGQYELRVKDLDETGQQSNEGLDFMVYSVITGDTRDIATLSGGESFMAALCLSMGMADIVRCMAGGIQIDMMFIDEGFGSLDEHSRAQAMQMLRELAAEQNGARIIGLISHVEELKLQVENILEVTKTEKGSSAAWSR